MKFQENLHAGVSRQDQKYFSPGGTLGGQFYVIKRNWTILQSNEDPI